MKKNSGLVSVIIPVYNTESYLRDCLESVLEQTYRNIEIIVVNDGSTDSSDKIINKYALKDGRIRKINKENGGLSSARNVAIDISTGEYIVFLDSDDCLEKTFIEELVGKIESYNLDFISCRENINGMAKTFKGNVSIYERDEAVFRYFKGDLSVPESCCLKMYKSELFSKIRFPLGKIHEDTFITYKIIENSSRIGYYHYNGYVVNQRNGSITRSPYTEKNYNKVEACCEMMKYYSASKYSKYAFDKLLGALLYYIIKTNRSNINNNDAYILLKELVNSNYNIELRFLPFVILFKMNLLKFVSI